MREEEMVEMGKEAAGTGGASAELAQGAMKILEMISGYWVTQVLRATAELSLADHVAAGIATSEEIAAHEGSDPATTYRLLRAAASLGLFADAGEHRFRVTPMGSLLCKGAPGSMRETAIAQGSPFHWQVWGALPEAVRKGRTQMHSALGLPEDATIFDYFAAHQEEGRTFAASMSNASNLVVEDVAQTLKLDSVSTAVDVGGSNGDLVLALLKITPGLQGVVLDRPLVVDEAVRAAQKAGVSQRFSAVTGDFFKEVPAADLYLLKMILHDWNDDQCVQILRNCRASAKPGGRAVVIESVIGKIGEPSFAAILDMNMLAATNGQERDFEEFDALYAAAGWKRTSTTPTRTPQFIQELVAI